VERLTRLVALASLIVALGAEAWLVSRAWPPAMAGSVAAFLAGVALIRWAPTFGSPAVLILAYFAPLLFRIFHGLFTGSLLVVWLAAIAGLIVGREGGRSWRLPVPWRWPLALWALTVAVSWPLVALREVDFRFGVLLIGSVANTGVGVPPALAVLAVLGSAILQLTGILWFDWLYERFERGGLTLVRREIIVPLGAGAAAACLFGIYQGFFDIALLSGGRWPILARAAGTLLDANAFGVVAAMWGPGLVALIWSRVGPARWATAMGALAVSWAAVWVSASRTAFLAAAIALVVLGIQGLRGASRPVRLKVRFALAALAVCMTLVILVVPSNSVGPLARIRSELLSPRHRTGSVAAELWRRNGYGSAAVDMIREHPLVGVGAGTFNMLVSDYSALAGRRIPFDNAQNWLRHQLAELGLVGSIGWLAWVALFTLVLVRTSGAGASQIPAAAVKGSLVGFGAASMFGVPSQSAAVSLTFWTFAFWYLALASPAAVKGRVGADWRWLQSRTAWVVALLLVAAHATGTLAVARDRLRPPVRAQRFGWDYHYGFYQMEEGPGGRRFRWTRREAVAVVPAEGRHLALELWSGQPDLATHPARVRVWLDSTLAADVTLVDGSRATREVEVPPGDERLVIRIEVSHTWRPSDFGAADSRELGVAVADWRFE
jgi:hypothetical protein